MRCTRIASVQKCRYGIRPMNSSLSLFPEPAPAASQDLRVGPQPRAGRPLHQAGPRPAQLHPNQQERVLRRPGMSPFQALFRIYHEMTMQSYQFNALCTGYSISSDSWVRLTLILAELAEQLGKMVQHHRSTSIQSNPTQPNYRRR